MNPLQRAQKFWRVNEPNWVVIILIVNFAFFAISLLATQPNHELGKSPSGESLYLLGSNVFHLVARGQVHRLIVANFLHGGFLHLAMNCFVLWQIGTITQTIMGSKRFLTLYIMSGITGTIASLGWKYFGQDFVETWQLVGSIGSSTSNFGILAFLLIWARRTPGNESLASQIIFWLLVNVAISFSASNIDNAGHVGGFIGGWIMAQALHSYRGGWWKKLLLSDRFALFLLVLVIVSFAAVPFSYFGEFGQTCRKLYQLRPYVGVVLDAKETSRSALKEAASEVEELRQEFGEEFPVDVKGLELKLRQCVIDKSQTGFVTDIGALTAEDAYRRFLVGYTSYLGHTSKLTYVRNR